MNQGNLLKLIRTKKGISQKDMAQKFGISQNYLSLIEANKKSPSLELISEFSNKLGFSKEAFVFASSEVPLELNENQKRDYEKLQDNIVHLLLFEIPVK